MTHEEGVPFSAGSFAVSGSFDIEWASEADIAGFFGALTKPAPGYEEIANADGIRWHKRIADDG